MALDFEADLDIFLNPEEHGTEAIIDPTGTPRPPINVIFETGEYTVDGHGGANITSSKPSILCKTYDLSGVVQGTKILVKGVTYRVHKPGPDEDGFTKLELHKL